MPGHRQGQFTLTLAQPPVIASSFTLVGPREGRGPLAPYFDGILEDDMFGETSAEKAERRFLEHAARRALTRAGLDAGDVQLFLAGDLLNQIVSATFTARSLGIPYLGLFAACATSAEALGLGAILVDAGLAERVLVATASHYQSAERQYRYPIELNLKRKLTNQRTATGAGAAVLARAGSGPRITHVTFGRVLDWGLKDPNDMGSAMAPAACDTLLRHLEDTGRTVADYDLILTGDLARYGSKLFRTLVQEAGISLGNKHEDSGALLYGPDQKVGAGGSGTACSMVAILGYVRQELEKGRWKRVLALPTGCLHSPLTWKQGDSCPGVCHGVVLEAPGGQGQGGGS